MKRFITSMDSIEMDTLSLNSEDAHYLIRVLRLGVGSQLELVIERQEVWHIHITELSKSMLRFKIVEKIPIESALSPRLILAQCLPKQDKMSTVLKMGTELGVSDFIPIISEYCDKKWSKNTAIKLERWRSIVKNAAQQSKQHHIPNIHPAIDICSCQKFCQSNFPDASQFYAWEHASVSIRDFFNNDIESTPYPSSIFLIIGPEGGLSRAEAAMLSEQRFHSLSLGRSILRTEHAGFYGFAQLLAYQY